MWSRLHDAGRHPRTRHRSGRFNRWAVRPSSIESGDHPADTHRVSGAGGDPTVRCRSSRANRPRRSQSCGRRWTAADDPRQGARPGRRSPPNRDRLAAMPPPELARWTDQPRRDRRAAGDTIVSNHQTLDVGFVLEHAFPERLTFGRASGWSGSHDANVRTIRACRPVLSDTFHDLLDLSGTTTVHARIPVVPTRRVAPASTEAPISTARVRRPIRHPSPTGAAIGHIAQTTTA